MHFKRQPQTELINFLIYYQICNNSQTGMHNNFIVLGGYKMFGYCTWNEDQKKTKHINEMQNLSPILESALNQKFKEFSLFSSSFSKNSSFQKAFQVLLKSKIKFQGFSRTSRSSMNLDINFKACRIQCYSTL